MVDLSSIPDPWAEVESSFHALETGQVSDELALERIKEEDWEVITYTKAFGTSNGR